jgi:hypothetical protein
MESKQKNELRKQVKQHVLSPQKREESSRLIYKYMLTNSRYVRSGNFKDICNSDLGMLFQITDEQHFNGNVSRVCEQTADRPLSFRLSTRMTTSGGTTTMQTLRERKGLKTEFEIAIATTPLFTSFRDEPTAIVSGITCRNRLEALQRIMEHEMIHLVEMLLWNDSNCAAKPFKSIVNRFFGHTESNHRLLTPSDLARSRLGISAGDLVRFKIEGRELEGHVNRITKRATILVPDPRGSVYDDGKKYQKYYVPIQKLKRA